MPYEISADQLYDDNAWSSASFYMLFDRDRMVTIPMAGLKKEYIIDLIAHWGRDTVADISQTSISKPFP